MFDCPPVEFLTTLARGSLRQDLPRTVRLWVILQSIYGEDIGLNLDAAFTYNDWRDRASLTKHNCITSAIASRPRTI
ncbi:MAG: hypothetical protein LH702_04115 [Phormidesmis sp. CAN_BIN44]|nr:hypothetical protein [Phormidesmis sp. CAN_BIN44]